ncbi:MAG: tetratricopeptide repeat protein [Candidatus Muiribacteriota bacterium]
MKKLFLIFLFIFISLNIFSFDLNKATLDELLTNAKIDMLDAMKILEYRKNNPALSVDDLIEKKIISFETGRKLRQAMEPVKVEAPQERNYRVRTSEQGISRADSVVGGEQPTESEQFQRILDFMQKQEFEKAAGYIRIFTRAHQDSEYLDDIIYFAGAIDEGVENYERAIRSYKRIVDNYYFSDISVIAIYRMAICYEKMKNTSDAISMYRKLISEFPNSMWVERAEKRLGELNF